MNWVERRDLRDSGTPEFWNLFCIEIEQSTVPAFRKSGYVKDHGLVVTVTRFNHCLHILYAKSGSAKAERSIDLCLDQSGHRIFSREGQEEQSSLRIGLDADMKHSLLDAEGGPITLDQASALFLEKFLFGEP